MEHWGVWWQTLQYFSAGSVALSQGSAVRQHSSWWTHRRGIQRAGQLSEQEPRAWEGSGVPLTGGKSRTLLLSVTNWPRPLPIDPSPVGTVKRLIDSNSWAIYGIQLRGSKKTGPARLAMALHSNRPKKEAPFPLDLHSLIVTLTLTFPTIFQTLFSSVMKKDMK